MRILRERRGLLTTIEPVTSIDIPESVREVVVRRLRRLKPSTRTVLSVASVTGVEIDYDAVVAASGLDEEGVLDALDEATAAAIVRETPSGSYEFVHPLVRSTIYTNLGSARRHQRHRHIAEALLQRPGSDPASVSYHLDRANVVDPRDRRATGDSREQSAAAPCIRRERQLSQPGVGCARDGSIRQARRRSADVNCLSHWAPQSDGPACRRTAIPSSRPHNSRRTSVKATCWHAPFWRTIAVLRVRSARSTRNS